MGKAHYMVKAPTEVRSPQRKLEPNTVGSESFEQTSLRGIANKAKQKPEHRFRDLYRLLTPRMLYIAWKKLNKKAAIADLDLTVESYEKDLSENLAALAGKLKSKRYRAKLVKRMYIPKGNGKQRPLGIPALEDKIVQRAVAMILESIYEQDFSEYSYGYRPNRSAKDAVSDLTFQLQYGTTGYIVEADIKGFFDNLDHDKLLALLSKRIDDKAMLSLIRKWLKAGILAPEGMVIHPDTGTPQGGIISPILANVYLHYVLDEWFEHTVKPRLRGRCFLYRYADDWVCGFQYSDDARAFYDVLPKRLARYNLAVEPSKTNLIRFSRFHPSREQTRVFCFLSFEFYWWHDRSGEARVMRRTSRKRQLSKVQDIKDWIKKERHLPKAAFFSRLKKKLQGHYNYYAIRGNSRAVWSYYGQVVEQSFKWLNRRSHRKSYTWEKFRQVLVYFSVPKPRIMERKRRHERVLC